MTEQQRDTPYPLRMSANLREELEVAAKASGRSLHQEILQRLQDSLKSLSTNDTENEILNRLETLEKDVAELKSKG